MLVCGEIPPVICVPVHEMHELIMASDAQPGIPLDIYGFNASGTCGT